MPSDLTFLKRTAGILGDLNDELGQMRAARELESRLADECLDADFDMRKAADTFGDYSDEYHAASIALSIKKAEHRLALERFERLHRPLPESDEQREPRQELSEDEINRRNWVNR
jgi:hypothetical protein